MTRQPVTSRTLPLSPRIGPAILPGFYTDLATVIPDRGARHIYFAGTTACGLRVDHATAVVFPAVKGQRISCRACHETTRA